MQSAHGKEEVVTTTSSGSDSLDSAEAVKEMLRNTRQSEAEMIAEAKKKMSMLIMSHAPRGVTEVLKNENEPIFYEGKRQNPSAHPDPFILGVPAIEVVRRGSREQQQPCVGTDLALTLTPRQLTYLFLAGILSGYFVGAGYIGRFFGWFAAFFKSSDSSESDGNSE